MTVTPVLLSASVTIAMVAFYIFCAFRVGVLRGKHGIKAPLCAGHPEFDRAYRVQLNTLEQMGIVLPLLWVATLFPVLGGWAAAGVGLVWVMGRIVYRRAYMAAPERRIAGAGIAGLCNLSLLVLALWGVAGAWIHAAH
jgi:glutathione S-transferase